MTTLSESDRISCMKKKVLKRKLRNYKHGVRFEDLAMTVNPEGMMTLTFDHPVKMVESFDDQVFTFVRMPKC